MSNILVIDDDEGFRYTLRRILEGAGHWICEAEDGEEGIKKAGTHQPDLIMVDWSMPKKDGIEVCRQLKADAPTRHIPIALITGKKTSPADEELWQSTGSDLYISKPIASIPEFLKAVQGLLHGLSGRKARDTASFGPLIVNRKEHVVSLNGAARTDLPSTLFDLLYHLVKKAPKVATRMYLIEKVWGEEAVKDREVDVAVSRLRKIFPALAPYLECSPASGYFLSPKLQMAAVSEKSRKSLSAS